MVAGNSLDDAEFSKLDEEPVIHINKISSIPKKLTSLSLEPKKLEFDVISESKEKFEVGEITHEYLKFINAHVMIRLHQIEQSLQRLEDRQLQHEEIKNKQNEKTSDKDSESDIVVKKELESLIKKYGIQDLTYAIDEISSKRILRNNNKKE
jgi:hypothetical protein